jgi:4'-phosphopantetheinyl transferase
VVVADAAAVVSLSYAADLVVAAVAPAQLISAVGLDAEPNTAGSERLTDLAKLIGGAPASALRRWTQLEAVLKADGRGLRVGPHRGRTGALPPRRSRRSAGPGDQPRVALRIRRAGTPPTQP